MSGKYSKDLKSPISAELTEITQLVFVKLDFG